MTGTWFPPAEVGSNVARRTAASGPPASASVCVIFAWTVPGPKGRLVTFRRDMEFPVSCGRRRSDRDQPATNPQTLRDITPCAERRYLLLRTTQGVHEGRWVDPLGAEGVDIGAESSTGRSRSTSALASTRPVTLVTTRHSASRRLTPATSACRRQHARTQGAPLIRPQGRGAVSSEGELAELVLLLGSTHDE